MSKRQNEDPYTYNEFKKNRILNSNIQDEQLKNLINKLYEIEHIRNEINNLINLYEYNNERDKYNDKLNELNKKYDQIIDSINNKN